MQNARQIIDLLELERHPEGGWYRETWRAPTQAGERAGATAIYFLLECGQRSHWHRVDAAEMWLWHAGHPLRLVTAPGDAGPTTETVLGDDLDAAQCLQHIVAANHWQCAETTGGWTLVSCVVTPGFEFSGFTLAAPDWAPAG